MSCIYMLSIRVADVWVIRVGSVIARIVFAARCRVAWGITQVFGHKAHHLTSFTAGK